VLAVNSIDSSIEESFYSTTLDPKMEALKGPRKKRTRLTKLIVNNQFMGQ
jgi:hypothetical protein